MKTYTISESIIKRILKKLIDEAIKTSNAGVHVRYYALQKENLTEESSTEDIEDAIETYVYSLHADMNYQDVIDQIDGNSIVKDLWNELPQSNHYQVYNQ